MTTVNDDTNTRYYQPQLMRPSTEGSSAEGANVVRYVKYDNGDEILVKPRLGEEPIQRVGGGRSGRRIGTGTVAGTSLGLSIWKNKNKEKRNGKKKSQAMPNDTFEDESQPQTARKTPVEEAVYRGQAGGSRSGRGLSIPKPISRGTDKSKPRLKGKGISGTAEFDEGSETGSVLSIGLGVPAEQWEREMGIAPLSKRSFNPDTLHALRIPPILSPPNLGTASQAGPSSMTPSSGSRLGAWPEEDEEGYDVSGSRESIRSLDRESDESFRRHPPPHYSVIQTPSIDPRMYSGTNVRRGVRPLPLHPEPPLVPPFPTSPSSPGSISPASTITSRAWPIPPQPAYARSVSSASSSSMPPTPPMHPLDLYTRSGRSKSPGPGQGMGPSMHSPTILPWGTPGLGTRSEGSLHTHEIPGNSGNSDEPGVISGIVNGLDAAGRPYQYTYQYQSASGAPPTHEELIVALPPSHYLRPDSTHPSPPHPTSPPAQFFRSTTTPQSVQAPPQQRGDHKPQQRPLKKRLIISGIGALGANDLHFDFDRAIDELHLAGSGSDGGHNDDDGNDSDIDPAISKRDETRRGNQRQSRAGEKGRSDTQSPGDQQKGNDQEREEAVIQWCRGFGDVLEVRRRGQGCLMVDFAKDGVVDIICRAQQVYIRGAGKVDLRWF